MKKGWEVKKLIEVCEKITDGTHQTPTYFDDGVLFLSSRNVTSGTIDWENVKYIDAKQHGEMQRRVSPRLNDILLAKNGTTGVAAMVDRDVPFDIYVSLALLRPLATVHPTFLLHFINSPLAKKQFTKRLKGVGVPNLHLEEIREVEIPIPPLPEQQRIVGILDKAFAGLAIAVANAEKNLQNARALFESHLQSVFTQRGEGWKMEKLDDLTELARGHNPPKSKFSHEQKPGYVRFYQIRDGGTDDYTVYVPDSPQLHKMKKDDIMLVAYRHVGRAFRGVEGAFNVALCKISNARRDLLDDDYLFHIVPSPFVKGELLKRSERSLIPSMSIEHLRELRIPLPPLPEQQKIVKLINSLSTETQRLAAIYERKLAALLELKKSLLHQAFNGEL